MIISRTPLRVSFVGGGTDLPSFCTKERGAVVSTAIKKYVYIVIHPSFDKKNLLSYSKIEKTEDLEEIQNTRIREAMRMTGVTSGVEIHSIAEVPSGTGMGSSSSFTVGLLNALYAYQGKHVSAERLAREACEIEINILKEPIGRQDQYAAAFGGLNKIEFIGEDVKVKKLISSNKTKKDLEQNMLLFYLNGQREAAKILAEQNKNIDCNKEILEMHLRMRDLADELEKNITEDNIDNFGELLHKNWLLKKSLVNGMSSQEIDKYYDLALKAGAKGGKVLGAGGTGFLLIYAEPDRHEYVRKALSELKEYDLSFDNEGSKIIYVGE